MISGWKKGNRKSSSLILTRGQGHAINQEIFYAISFSQSNCNYSKPERAGDSVSLWSHLPIHERSLTLIEEFMLDEIKITSYNMKSQYLHGAMWKCGSHIFIVYLNFITSDFALKTFNSSRFMYGAWELKS